MATSVTTRSTFKHAAIYSLATILGKAISFFLLPFYAHIFGDTGYGILGMIDASMGLLLSLLGYGISGGIIRFFHEESEEKKALVISTGLILVWFASLFSSLVLMIFSRPLSVFLFGDSSYYLFVILSLITFVFDLTGQSASTFLIIRQKSALYSVIGLLRLVIGISINIYLVIVKNWGLNGLFIGNLFTAFFFSIIFNFIAFRYSGVHFNKSISKKLIAFEMPLIPGNIISYFSRQVERFLVRFQINLGSVGILEMAYKFPPLLSLFIAEPFMQSWHTKRTEIAEDSDAPKLFGKTFTAFLFLMVFSGLMLSVSIKEILIILTPPEFWPAYKISRIEIITVILMASYYHLFFGLYYQKKTQTISLIKSVISLVKIPLSFFFIKFWGLFGAAYSALLTSAIQLGWSTIKSQKLYPIHIEYKKIVLILLVAFSLDIMAGEIHFNEWSPVVYTQQKIAPWIISFLGTTFLTDWKSGKVITLFQSKVDTILLLLCKVMFSLLFLLIIPLIHPPFIKTTFGYIKKTNLLKALRFDRLLSR